MLEGKTIVLGITGSIAAYKIATLASMLVKKRADVRVVMTKNATEFITPFTFETLTHNKCLVDTFDRDFEYDVKHISLAQKADVLLIAPATANIIAKIAHGIADDMLSTLALAFGGPLLMSPAMNTGMLEKEVTKDNIEKLKGYGAEIISPAEGYLACGTEGKGKMAEPYVLYDHILKACLYEKDFEGRKVLVTAGPTMEKIDPVRFISNHSTGTMGYEIAREASFRGADVTLISGKTNLTSPPFIRKQDVTSAEDMYEAVTDISDSQDIIIMAAAVADFRPKNVSDEKIKKASKGNGCAKNILELEPTEDILMTLGQKKKKGQFLCGFAMETKNMEEEARKKLISKNADLIVANNVKLEGSGFGYDTNVVTMVTKDEMIGLPMMGKGEVSHKILDQIKKMLYNG